MEFNQGIQRINNKIEELFGNPDNYNLHALPIETLEAMKSWLAIQLDYLGEEKTRRYESMNNSKSFLKSYLAERKTFHLNNVSGSDRVRVATIYAEVDAKTHMQNLTILENAYEEVKNKEKSAETIRMSIVQTISTVNKSIDRKQFID